MKCRVLTAFEDKEHKINLKVGDTFIPAETNYPTNLVNQHVIDGDLQLVTEKPAAQAKRK